ncbi:hypothetical protein N658DRAFT_133001 [Parathielavia hyrcaniae]|uniref:Uncharacterized protein n=1 Tax=Parathielavia hyrcaniae TaxID=113614 RepID=A0AAN6T692_9PEZI|nr:hypothetical protein N658DRAFT_133001 [Parathielavia hyrcaniae]
MPRSIINHSTPNGGTKINTINSTHNVQTTQLECQGKEKYSPGFPEFSHRAMGTEPLQSDTKRHQNAIHHNS